MNDPEVRAIPESNGYRAEFKKVHLSGWHAVRINGVAQLYETPELAEVAAYRALMQYLFGHGIVRSGEKACAGNSAEIKRIFPGKGRKPVPVEVSRK